MMSLLRRWWAGYVRLCDVTADTHLTAALLRRSG
jgi:hypothetical protein